MTQISGANAKCWWFDPRTGDPTLIGTYPTAFENRTFTSPDTNDWVLVLDDATKNLPAPGTTAYAGTARPPESPGDTERHANRSPNGRGTGDANGAPTGAAGVLREALTFELRTVDAVTRNQSEFGAKSGNRIRIWLQQTDGPWRGAELDCPQGEGLAVADLDRDGEPDIVIWATWFETIREGGQVRWQAHVFAEFHRNATVSVADFNGDARPDVALAPSELAGQHYRLSWFEAPEDPRVGSWGEHRLADHIEAVVHSLAAADFDRDGRMDIAFAQMHQGADPDEVGIFLNRGAGHPWEKIVVSTTGSHGLQTLDVDGDGVPDVFGANWSGALQAVQLWRNSAGLAARASAGESDDLVASP